MAKYTSVSISGYNATPPADDGTVSESNKVKWSTEKTKLTDPLKTALESINTNLVSAFDVGPTALITNTTLGTSHYGDFIQVSGAGVTLTLTDAATLGSGWYCEIINTDSTNTVTIGRATGGDTINGTAANISLLPYQAISVFVNAAANGFIATAKRTHSKEYKQEEVLTMNGKSLWMAEGADVASATDCNIWTTDGNTVHVTGTTTISDWGTAPQAGATKMVIFDGALQLTYDATTNKLNTGGANYTTVAGDRAFVYAESTSSYIVTIYPLSGASPVPATAGSSMVLLDSKIASNSTSLDFTTGINSTYDVYKIVFVDLDPANAAAVGLWVRISTDGGSTWKSGASDYQHASQGRDTNGGLVFNSSAADANFVLNSSTNGVAAASNTDGEITFYKPSTSSKLKQFSWNIGFVQGTTGYFTKSDGVGRYIAANTAINGVSIFFQTGNITSGEAYLYGIRKA